MKHTKFEGLMSPYEKTVRVAEYAVDIATKAMNNPNGTGVFRNQNGSMTIITGGNYNRPGIPGGFIPWVGDKTPPGKPIGVSADSAWGIVYVTWGGELEGGVPADFAYVQVTIDGVEKAHMGTKGTLSFEGFQNGQVITIGFTSFDAAVDIHGLADPNTSETVEIKLTVYDAKAEIDKKVEEIENNAAAADEAADALANKVDGLIQQVEDNATAAGEAADKLAEQISDVKVEVGALGDDVNSISTTVSGVAETANQALTQATQASQDLTGFKQVVSETYVNHNDLDKEIDSATTSLQDQITETSEELTTKIQDEALARSSAITQSKNEILQSVSQTYATTVALGDAISQEVLDRNAAIKTASDSIKLSVSETYATKDGVTDTVNNIVGDALDDFKATADKTYASQAQINISKNEILQEVSSTYATSEEVDGAIAQEVLDRNAAIRTATDGINLSVSQTYATKSGVTSEVNSAIDDFKAEADQLYATQAQIDVSKDSILQEVSNKYATTSDVDGAIAQEVLDRNAAIKTATDKINLSVSETYATKAGVTDTVNNIVGDALDDFKATADQTYAAKAAIDISKNEILQSVSETYTTKNELNGAIAQEVLDRNTAIDQKADSIELTASQAVKTANNAYEQVNSLRLDMDGLTVNIGEIQTTANNAASTAQDAVDKANSVQSIADNALDVAQQAVDMASVQFYGDCQTSGSATEKVVTTTGSDIFKLKSGVTIQVKFRHANTAANPKLNVNNTGAKTIFIYNASIPSTSQYNWEDNSIVNFVYYGTGWYIVDGGSLKKAGEALDTANQAKNDALEASKVASNYLHFDSNGLVVGNMTASNLGYNTLMRAGGVDIRNGSTVLATFNANSISLGLNSKNSYVSLCGGLGQLRYASATTSGGVSIPAGLEIRGENTIRLTTRYSTTQGYNVVFYVNAYSDGSVGTHFVSRTGFDRNQVWFFYTTTSTTSQLVFAESPAVDDPFNTINAQHVVGFRHAGNILGGPTWYHGHAVFNTTASSYYCEILSRSEQISKFGRTFNLNTDQFYVMNGDQNARQTNVTPTFNQSTRGLGFQVGAYLAGSIRIAWTAHIAYTDGSIEN